MVRFGVTPERFCQEILNALQNELEEFELFRTGKFLNSLSVTTARMKPFNRDSPDWISSAEFLDNALWSAVDDLRGSVFHSFDHSTTPRAICCLCRSIRTDVTQLTETVEIRLCASSLNDGTHLSAVTRTLGSVGRLLGLKGARFGLVHVYPMIGPVRLHWDTSEKVSITLEKKQNVVIRLRLHEIVCTERVHQLRLFLKIEKLARLIDDCNRNYSYDVQGEILPKHHNCQTFSLSILRIIVGGFQQRVPEAVYEYLTKTLPSLITSDEPIRRLNLKSIRLGKYRFGRLFPAIVEKVSALGTGFKVGKSRFLHRLSWASFSTSAEVQLFMDLVSERYCDFSHCFPGEWLLLQGFSASDGGVDGLKVKKQKADGYVVSPFFDPSSWCLILL